LQKLLYRSRIQVIASLRQFASDAVTKRRTRAGWGIY
jgi:hypothetical protein